MRRRRLKRYAEPIGASYGALRHLLYMAARGAEAAGDLERAAAIRANVRAMSTDRIRRGTVNGRAWPLELSINDQIREVERRAGG